MAGGLARRVAMVAEARAANPGAVYIDLGGQGVQPAPRPLIARPLAALEPAAVGAGPDDLLELAPWADLPLTSLTPPTTGPAPPASRVVEAGGVKVAVLSVAFGPLTTRELADQAATAIAARRAEGCAVAVLLSHLSATSTERLVDRLPAADRPHLVALATDADEPGDPYEKLGATWVPLAHKGRSLATVRLVPAADGWAVEVEQRLVDEGPVDPEVQAWVDAYHAAQAVTAVAASPSPYPRPSACLPCHEPAVTAWRGHAHGRAVATLEAAGRLTPDCLPCHDERYRREQVRSAPPDAGVECATCHGGLAAHLADSATPTTPATDCLTCHTPEHSPAWDAPRYCAAVTAVCAPG